MHDLLLKLSRIKLTIEKKTKSNIGPIDTEYYTTSHNLLRYYKHLIKSFLHKIYCAGLHKIQSYMYIIVGPENALNRYAIKESAL